MRPTAGQLAIRDAALAAFLDITPGSDFGSEHDHSRGHSDFGAEFGSDFGAEFGGDWGAEFGNDYGADAAMVAPAAAAMMQHVGKHGPIHPAHPQHPTNRRARLLDPNAGSEVKVEGYSLSLNQTLTLGTAVAIQASLNPDVLIKPQTVSANVPAPGMATLSQLQVANVNAIIGGTRDLFAWNANAVNRCISLPKIQPSQRLSMAGSYSGFVPASYTGGNAFILDVGVAGPAVMAGQ